MTDNPVSRVLVADDDPVNRKLLCKILQTDGYRTVETDNGIDAWRVLTGEPVDMVLLDIEMPGMGGYDVLRNVRHTPRTADLPIVMVSALEDTQSVVHAIELGADDYVTKPISPTLLRARTHAIIERKRLRDREQERIRSVFCRFVPETIADRLLLEGETRLLGEKTVVTVLFCDLRSFTSWAEANPPETVIEVLNCYLGVMSDMILDHGGTLVSYLGDGLMAVFGAPIPMEDHADLALEAAQTMAVSALPEFNFWVAQNGYGHGFRMGIGLNSGPVMAGTVGTDRRIEYTAVGDTVNTASRLEQMTKDTGLPILVSAETRSLLLRAGHDLTLVGEITLRGKARPTALWTLGQSKSFRPPA
ncbi:adenylate/guanylate cyclase domain-containing protein [Streptomyces sp. 1222.5]|uniref:adenylate/guanylate cyclase domain-containing protein n=1 Tax=Streptomyces sp. 1222.5 TaxID=1881026 RepID=UPI003EB9EFEE